MAEVKHQDGSFQARVPNYPSNSKKNQNAAKTPIQDIPKPEKVTSDIKIAKKSIGKRLLDAFIPMPIDQIPGYLFDDILVPMIKRGFVDLAHSTINVIFQGKDSPIGSGSQNKPYTSYSNFYYGGQSQRPQPTVQSSKKPAPNEVIFPTHGQATEVLGHMMDYIQDYGRVRMSDFYQMVSISAYDFTDNYWGWTDLSSASVSGVRDGFIINFPRPIHMPG